MKLIIVANKWWEAAPLVAALQHVNSRQRDLGAVPGEFADASQPGPGRSSAPAPRVVMHCGDATIEVWCIQDLMDPDENSSLTWEKARVLRRVLRGADPNAIIAFGTAASPTGSGRNGNVVIGTSVFVHDPYQEPPNKQKHWTSPLLNQVVRSDIQAAFDKIPRQFVTEAEKRLLRPPNAAATPPHISADSTLVSVGVVNVTNSAHYAWTDQQALAKFQEVTGSANAESLETTHGVIRLELGSRFLYVSGIANAVGKFGEQVSPNAYSQNFVAAHNAAIAVGWLMPSLIAALQTS